MTPGSSARASVILPDWLGPESSTIFFARSVSICAERRRFSMRATLPACEKAGKEFHMHVKNTESRFHRESPFGGPSRQKMSGKARQRFSDCAAGVVLAECLHERRHALPSGDYAVPQQNLPPPARCQHPRAMQPICVRNGKLDKDFALFRYGGKN